MNREIASALIQRELETLRRSSYGELTRLVNRVSTSREIGQDGKEYQIERQAVWDDAKGGNIRVIVAVDDGGLSAFRPLCGDFIISASGAFIGKSGRSSFRIAIGRCSCRSPKIRRSIQPTCAEVLARLERLRGLSLTQLMELPESQSAETRIEGMAVKFTTYHHALQGGRTLIVVQAFIRTARWPTYISFKRVGHILAEGLIIHQDGRIEEAPDDALWAYR